MRKLFGIFLVMFLVVIVFNLSREIWNSYQSIKEISKTEEELDKLQKEQEKLKAQLDFRKSDFFVEEQARDKLGFSKPGEEAIIIKDESLLTKPGTSEERNLPNWRRWLSLFCESC